MATVNKKRVDHRIDQDPNHRLAGGYGMKAARQDAEAHLRRCVMSCLLWEKLAYQDGVSVANLIGELVPQIDPEIVAQIAIDARHLQKLRHTPLWIAVHLARNRKSRYVLGDLLPKIITRPDQVTEFLALYWQDGKVPIAKQVKLGLARALTQFDRYQLAKYQGTDKEIKLKDVMFLVHPSPKDSAQAQDFKDLASGDLPSPDTWEVALSTGQDKRETWTRLIKEKRIGALAFIRNLRGMESAGVNKSLIEQGFDQLNTKWLLPFNYVVAARACPEWATFLERKMIEGLSSWPKLPGMTLLINDVSLSMGQPISAKGAINRLGVAGALSILVMEVAEDIILYSTSGSDIKRTHFTRRTPRLRGFALSERLNEDMHSMGGGGIFTRQCLDYVRQIYGGPKPDRILIFSDSQDCDNDPRLPEPFGIHNYIIDVSAHMRGINYQGIWTAEISGWSEHLIQFIYEIEGIRLEQGGEFQ